MAWIAGLWLVNTALLIIIAVREVRRPAKALTWISVGLVLPIIGFVCYLFVTNPVQMRRDKLVSSHNSPISLPPRIWSLRICYRSGFATFVCQSSTERKPSWEESTLGTSIPE
ncbi:PLDc N-terminal domain-containing protein [Paenibacillus sp. Dod16]|uniref:PLDc N-terminal domain-containing protein n=1 Tax=Paenibacillus sp. Dod16 TaxID=3416392 RepID=UPI003CEA3CA0